MLVERNVTLVSSKTNTLKFIYVLGIFNEDHLNYLLFSPLREIQENHWALMRKSITSGESILTRKISVNNNINLLSNC